jgi:hypothetical protein
MSAQREIAKLFRQARESGILELYIVTKTNSNNGELSDFVHERALVLRDYLKSLAPTDELAIKSLDVDLPTLLDQQVELWIPELASDSAANRGSGGAR